MDRIPVTREGYERKKAELAELEKELTEIAHKVAEARAEGDLRENAEYHAQRERQGQHQARINALKNELARAEIIDPQSLPKDIVVFGARVKVLDLDLDGEEEFELVGPGQEDYDNNRILVTSPMGAGLIGKRIGDVAEIAAPMGTIRFKILDISFPALSQ